jgi:3-oxoacyl-[acyl-carrier-protein] synthase III
VTLPVAIAGIGAYLPSQIVTNDDLSKVLDTSDEWIRTRTGIRQRHIAADDEATSDLAAAAARRRSPTPVWASRTSLRSLWRRRPRTTSFRGPHRSSRRVWVPRLAAFDINAACSGFIYALRVGGAMAA